MEFLIGDKAEYSKKITDEYINSTALWSGDNNPIHISDEYAGKTRFGQRIAHGLVCLGMVSNVVGNTLPGEGSILINQTINYMKPVFIDDIIKCTVEIENIEKNDFYLKYICTNQHGDTVLHGKIKLRYLPQAE